MSYTLQFWHQPAGEPYPETFAAAFDLLDRLHGEAVPADAAFTTFARRLTARHPCLCSPEVRSGSVKAVWADGPLDGVTDEAVFDLSLVSSAVDSVLPFILDEARQLGLNVMDEQSGVIHFADGGILADQ